MSLHETGMKTRRKVLGDKHVDSAIENTTEFDQPFQDLIVDAAWGHVWARPNLSLRERSLITIGILAALGQDEEVVMHVRAAKNTGATSDEICEALLHVAIYAGVPAGNHAFKIVKQTLAEMDKNGGRP